MITILNICITKCCVYCKSSSMEWLGWKIKHTFLSFLGKHLSNSWLTLVLQPEVYFCNLYFAVIPPEKWHPVSQLTYGKMFHVSSLIKWGQTSLSEADAYKIKQYLLLTVFWNYLFIPKFLFKTCQLSYQGIFKNGNGHRSYYPYY